MAELLVVDDDAEIRSTLKEFLQDEGHSVRDAADGAAALRIFDEAPADLILLDLMMPGKEGIETIQEIRQRAIPVKIIAMSGAHQNLDAARLLGADSTLDKPFHYEAMLALINDMLD